MASSKHDTCKLSLRPERVVPVRVLRVVMAVLLSVIICGLSVSSCSSDVKEPTASTGHGSQEQQYADQSEEHFISIGEGTFNPDDVTINRGDAVTWINDDSSRHSIVSVYHFQDEDDVSHIFLGETWVSGDIMPGQSFSRVFNESGVFSYFASPVMVRTPMEQYRAFSQVGVGVVVVK